MALVDPLYEGKEQSLVKHEVLRKYLSTFAHKVGSWWDSITYVDGFSGPWNSVSADLKDSSFAIAIGELRQARDTHRAKKKDLKLRCFFVEENPDAFKQLEDYANAQTDVEIRPVHACFEQAIPEILQFIKEDKKTFTFTLIDPKGWTGFALDTIRPLIRVQPGEVLVNFMTSFIIRFVDVDEVRDQLAAMYGSCEALDRIRDLRGMDRTDACVSEYCAALKSAGGFDFVSPAVVLQPTRDRPHFHLIYGTRKLVGLDVFKKAERQAMDVMERARATAEARKERAKGHRSLFAPEEMPDSIYYMELRDRYMGRSKQDVVDLLRSIRKVSYDEVWATALSRPLVWESDLKGWIDEWKKAGSLDVEGLGNEKSPKVGKRHFLMWKAE
jgi:three-Cys-motif partner protein